MDDDGWDAYAEGWDTDEGARAYAGAAFTALQALCEEWDLVIDGARVIDFGCGTGLLTEQLVGVGAIVDAVDTSMAMLAVLDQKVTRNGWTGVRTSPEVPADAVSVDLVVCSSVCSFLDDYPGTAAELVERLRPGGAFIQWDWERADGDDHGLTREEIGEALRRAGLRRVVVETGFVVTVGDHTMRPLVGHGRRPA